MADTLVIVESPSKARTLAQLLGAGYSVKASVGHVRDLPRSELAVDIDNDFQPQYVTIPEKRATIKDLRQAAARAGHVYLATDPDREGESISWHLAAELKLVNPERIAFHEITKSAVERALSAPRPLDMNLVNAQQARRVLDRLVGYQISPLLWRKVRGGARSALSAGRVQSVAVRLVVDREADISAFPPVEYWILETVLANPKGQEFTARLVARGAEPEGKLEVHSAAESEALTAALEKASYRVLKVELKPNKSQPRPPYITSSLQQDASARLRFSPRRTMSIAQQLYEGVTLGAEGLAGLITYMRTDSTRLSPEAEQAARAHIVSAYGARYAAGKPRKFKLSASAQDAHEAIRPTDPARTPESMRPFLTEDQARLYTLIWNRFTASQMSAAEFDSTRVDVLATGPGGESEALILRAQGSVLRFDGFQKVWGRDSDREKEDERALPSLTEAEALVLRSLNADQKFTQPPPRYTEATLIKELEERGIGRPSTYASIVDTIMERDYVRQEERRLHPTPLGTTVNTLLVELFPDLLDVGFTAQMEEQLDEVEQGRRQWVPLLRDFYGPFSETVKRATEDKRRVSVPAQATDEICPECSRPLVIRQGKFGEFTACSGFPECKYIKKDLAQQPVPTGFTCVEKGCGGEIMERKSHRGKTFFGCANYPKCTAVFWHRPTGEACPTCGKPTVAREGKTGVTIFCSDVECPTRAGEKRRAPRPTRPAGGAKSRPRRGTRVQSRVAPR